MWWETVFECGVFTLTAIWILAVLIRGSWKVDRLFIVLPLLVMTLYVYAQAVAWPAAWFTIGNHPGVARNTLTIDPYQTHLTARKLLSLTLFLSLLLVYTSNTKRLRWLTRVVIALGLASAVFGILRQLTQSPDSDGRFVLPFLFYGMGYGQFLSANAFAYVMHMTLALLGGLVFGGGVPRNRLPFYVAIGLLIFAALVLSNSRGGVLSLVCQSIFLLMVAGKWYFSRRAAKSDQPQHEKSRFRAAQVLFRAAAVLLIMGTLIAGVFWLGGERLSEKEAFDQGAIEGTSRKETWRSSWSLIKEHPLTGVGFGAYFLAITQYQTGSGKIKMEYAHNDYLDLAASGGLVAVVLGGWFIVLIIRRARVSLQSSDRYRRAVALGAAAGILGVAVHSLVDFGLQLTGIAVMFAALIVILVGDFKSRSNVSREKSSMVSS